MPDLAVFVNPLSLRAMTRRALFALLLPTLLVTPHSHPAWGQPSPEGCPATSDSLWINSLPGISGTINDLIRWNGQLLAAGQTGTVGGYAVKRWNGTTWDNLGLFDGYLNTLAVMNDRLYVGGSFRTVNGTPTSNIVSFDGNEWSALGAGTTGNVWALAEWNGQLFVGGRFDSAGAAPAASIAAWDGTTWSPLGSGCPGGGIYALKAWNNQLVVGGSFTTAGGIPTGHIALWDGTTWSSPGGGFDREVKSLEVFEGDLIAGGFFRASGSIPLIRVARWRGTEWESIGNGLPGGVYTLLSVGPRLYAGGTFYRPDRPGVRGVGCFSGEDWCPLGTGFWWAGGFLDGVLGLEYHGGDLVAAGALNIVGGHSIQNIAVWDLQPADVSAVPDTPGRPVTPPRLRLVALDRRDRSARIELTREGRAVDELLIFSVHGRCVRRIQASGGDPVIHWDGRDTLGRKVPAGSYFVVVAGKAEHIALKLSF